MNGQTDKQTKSSWWSLTAFNEDMDNLVLIQEGMVEMPSNWKRLYGGVEECPKTGKKHFQGALNTAHIRMSNIKKILPTAHLEPCKHGAENLKRYAMKDETSVGEKKVVSNARYMPMEECLILLAVKCHTDYEGQYNELDDSMGFWQCAESLLEERIELTALVTQPQMLRAWKNMYGFWWKKGREKRYSITSSTEKKILSWGDISDNGTNEEDEDDYAS